MDKKSPQRVHHKNQSAKAGPPPSFADTFKQNAGFAVPRVRTSTSYSTYATTTSSNYEFDTRHQEEEYEQKSATSKKRAARRSPERESSSSSYASNLDLPRGNSVRRLLSLPLPFFFFANPKPKSFYSRRQVRSEWPSARVLDPPNLPLLVVTRTTHLLIYRSPLAELLVPLKWMRRPERSFGQLVKSRHLSAMRLK